MNKLEQAARALLAHWDTPAWKYLKPTGDLMADLREALAEPQITTPDVCGEVCARAKLCYGCNKDLEEANAKYAEQAEQEPSKQQEALQELKEWQLAYPLSVFPEPDCTKAQQALESVGMTLDSLSASTLRWALDRVMQIVEEALEQPNCQQLSTSTDNTEHQEPVALIEECREALAQELMAYDIDPPIHHVKQAHDKCVAWLFNRTAPVRTKDLTDEEIEAIMVEQGDLRTAAFARAVIAADREKNK